MKNEKKANMRSFHEFNSIKAIYRKRNIWLTNSKGILSDLLKKNKKDYNFLVQLRWIF